MSDIPTGTDDAAAAPDTSQIVPGWRSLLEQVRQRDERIAELEREIDRLERENRRLRAADSATGDEAGESKAAELVDALRETAES